MAKKKKPTLPDLSKVDPLDVIDVTQLGSSTDPCFGKGYNLSTKECKLCGDSELCALKMAQVLKITRKELEEKKKKANAPEGADAKKTEESGHDSDGDA